MKTRVGIAGIGLGVIAFGGLRFLQTGWGNIVDSVIWLAGGVAAHDGVIAPLTILLTVVALRLLPPSQRARVTLALIVLATVTITAIPVLGRFGARADNATLLDRNYTAGWLIFAAVVLLVTVTEGVWHGSRPRRR